jgi:hypothetical protein
MTKLKNNQQTITTHWQHKADWWITDRAPEEKGKAKKQAPSNQSSTVKTQLQRGQLVGYRVDSGTWGQHTNLNCLTPLREELTKSCLWKTEQKKNTKHYPTTWNNLVRLQDRASAYIQTPGLDAGGVTPELKIRLKFYYSWTQNFCLFALFLVCLSISPCWFFCVCASFTIVN